MKTINRVSRRTVVGGEFQALERRRLLSGDGFELLNNPTVLDESAYVIPSNSPTPQGTPATEYNVTFRFAAGTPAAAQTAFQNGAAIWESLLRGDIPDVFVSGIGNVDDVFIDAAVVPIDGPGNVLGSAGPTAIRNGSSLPAAGQMRFDSADFTDFTTQAFLNVILHEMGHVLGVGTIWTNRGLRTGSGNTLRFIGAEATGEYQNLVRGRTVNGVDVEDDGGGGTAGSHWNDVVSGGENTIRQGFANELMTGFLNGGNNPLSRISVASMADLGYPSVNLDGGAVYTLPVQTGWPSGNDLPAVGTLSSNPNPSSSQDITLTLSSATDADGVARVGFWLESNGQTGLQGQFLNNTGGFATDTFIAFDTSSTGGWSTLVDDALVPNGASIFYARAEDTLGAVSAVRQVTHTANTDATPPTVTAKSFDFDVRQAVLFTFSEPVTGVDVADLVVTNLTTNTVVPSSRFFLGADTTTTTAVWQYDVDTHGPLSNGNYTAALPAGSVQDAAGNPLASDETLSFYFLNGDANRDRTVNLADFAILRANFGQSPRSFSEGDFNYDLNVNLADFAILRGNFGVTIPTLGSLFGGGGDDGTDGGGAGVLA